MGPVSIAIQADQYVFQAYTGGILNDEACGTTLDHGVAIVGFGSEGSQDYWIVRNSWGAAWGDNGYFKMQRNVNMCGVQNCNSYPMDVVDLKPNAKEFLQ